MTKTSGARRMIPLMDKSADKHVHLSNFDRFVQDEGTAVTPPWLERLRREAIARFDLVGFPSRKEELWRFTNVEPIVRTPFKLRKLSRPDNGAPSPEKDTLRPA